MDSIWTNTTTLPQFPALQGDAKTKVLIIGGGIAGILCAFFLEQEGVDYILVEADCLCSGVTQYTTAKLTFQHGLIYDRLLRQFGREKAALYLQANAVALHQYEQLCQGIDCDYEKKDAFVYSLNRPEKLEKEWKALEILGYDEAEYVPEVPLPMPTAGAIRFPNQAQFHPLQFLEAISRRLRIYEHTKVLALGEGVAKTNHGTIRADAIVVATHFPFLNKHGAYFLKMYQSRSYVLALKKAKEVQGMYVEEKENGLSFRTEKDLLLLGGGGHRTGKKGGNWNELLAFAKKYEPEAVIVGKWATQDCMTLDQVPYIGLYGKRAKGLYTATGFCKWGMTSSMVSALLLRDLLLARETPFASVFDPHRTLLRPQLFVNAFESGKNLLSLSEKRCPHLGCALKWNQTEHSRDCPCHGSRFAEDGKLLNNPAADDLKQSSFAFLQF